MKYEERSIEYKWVILIMLFFSQLILSISVYGLGPLGPYLKKSLSLTTIEFGSFTSILYLVGAVISLPAGMSVDRWGARINLFICMMLMGLSMILASLTQSYLPFALCIGIAGIGYGMSNPISSRGLTLWFDAKSRATAFSLRQTAVPVGGAIAGLLMIYLAELRDWSFAFRIIGIIAIGIGVVSFLFYREMPEQALDNSPDNSSVEQGHIESASLMDLIKNSNLLLTFLMMTLLCIGQSCLGAFLVLYLKEGLNFAPVLSGSFFTLTMITGGVARILWGVVSDKLFKGQRLPVMRIICALGTISALAASFWSPDIYPYLFILIAVLFGLSFLGFHGVAGAMIVEVCGAELAGRVAGLAVAVIWIGMVLGPVIFGAIASSGYFYAWLFIATTSLAATLICLSINEKKTFV